MNIAVQGVRAPQQLEFTGRIGGYWGLALVNLLLTVVTFGIYRFWAKTRSRAWLWAAIYFDGEPLEYRGRGVELLVGALLAFALILVPFFVFAVVIAMLAPVVGEAAVLLYLPVYIGLIWLLGVGSYRAQRYLLSRTSWRGIRGGMANGGWGYGGLFLKMLLLQLVTLGFASPYVSTRLWNALWNDASFGSAQVVADAQWRSLFKRFLFAWLAAIAVYIATIAILVATLGAEMGGFVAGGTPRAPDEMMGTIATVYGIALLAGLAIAFIMLSYTAALHRELFGATRLGALGFVFDATTGDWVKYLLVNVALVVLTLGLGLMVMPFRVWSFYLSHLSTTGRLDVDHLLQTDVAAPVQGDGIADAFDMSSF